MQETSQTSTNTPQFHNFGDLPDPESSTLAIGQECLNFFDGDAKKAVEKFNNHKTEIILTALHNLLSSLANPNRQVFKGVLELIKISDEDN